MFTLEVDARANQSRGLCQRRRLSSKTQRAKTFHHRKPCAHYPAGEQPSPIHLKGYAVVLDSHDSVADTLAGWGRCRRVRDDEQLGVVPLGPGALAVRRRARRSGGVDFQPAFENLALAQAALWATEAKLMQGLADLTGTTDARGKIADGVQKAERAIQLEREVVEPGEEGRRTEVRPAKPCDAREHAHAHPGRPRLKTGCFYVVVRVCGRGLSQSTSWWSVSGITSPEP